MNFNTFDVGEGFTVGSGMLPPAEPALRPPRWSKSKAGVEQVTYMLERAPDLSALLEESALAFGVTPASARSWAADPVRVRRRRAA